MEGGVGPGEEARSPRPRLLAAEEEGDKKAEEEAEEEETSRAAGPEGEAPAGDDDREPRPAAAAREAGREAAPPAPPAGACDPPAGGWDEPPPSFRENSPREEELLVLADSFQRQYSLLYPDRRPLLLCPANECGVQKFVCTTLRPTLVPYLELHHWQGSASFVSDCVVPAPLEPPTALPSRLASPVTVLRRQRANSLEASSLLCSLLLGAGYDAYCVCGYADRPTCLADESRADCPLLREPEPPEQAEPQRPPNKYTVRRARDLRSHHEERLEERRQAEERAAQERRRREEEASAAERERPSLDPLHGLRVHCWVLVRPGRRGVAEAFFVEPLSGRAFSTADGRFLGVESVWNHRNYWVNVQDCRHGCQGVSFHVHNALGWEAVFPGVHSRTAGSAAHGGYGDGSNEEEDEEEEDDPERGQEEEERPGSTLPPSWVGRIQLSPHDLELRCPGGRRTVQFRRARLEKLAPFLQRDGLTSRLSVFRDDECTQLVEVRETYSHRKDRLERKLLNKESGLVTEHFAPGRADCLKEHTFASPVPETERRAEFYSAARVDGLRSRRETALELWEEFEGRGDRLRARHAQLGPRVKRAGPAGADSHCRPVLKVTEDFDRDPSRPADEDPSRRTFLLAEERVSVLYHQDPARITRSCRHFLKPPCGTDGTIEPPGPDSYSAYQADPAAPQLKKREIYEMLVELMAAEEKTLQLVRKSEEEVREMLLVRAQEEATSQLVVSVYDTLRNHRTKQRRQELERLRQEEQRRREEPQLDYLAPFLARLGDPEELTRRHAERLRSECLDDVKRQLTAQANAMQERLEKEVEELQQQEGARGPGGRAGEEERNAACEEAAFRVLVTEQRLHRHKATAPHVYAEMERRLQSDPRLSALLQDP
ncbi:dynein regulatory complex subunit 7 [Lampetra fluviatilis]